MNTNYITHQAALHRKAYELLTSITVKQEVLNEMPDASETVKRHYSKNMFADLKVYEQVCSRIDQIHDQKSVVIVHRENCVTLAENFYQ